MSEFTETQQKMLTILSDGRVHTKEELHGCCGPSSISTVRAHVYGIKQKLRRRGEDIVCAYDKGRFYYQHVRLLGSNAE